MKRVLLFYTVYIFIELYIEKDDCMGAYSYIFSGAQSKTNHLGKKTNPSSIHTGGRLVMDL